MTETPLPLSPKRRGRPPGIRKPQPTEDDRLAAPFLKWVGGKRQIMDVLIGAIEPVHPFARFHEVFVGGGALFFELHNRGWLRSGARLCDINPHLVEAYRVVRDDVETLIARLVEHQEQHAHGGEAHYYAVRKAVPGSAVDRAARLLYLNRTGFNGLYRENSRGEFNVPFGRYTNPKIARAAALRATSRSLQGVEVAVASFEQVLDHAAPGDLVYCDPPYEPLSDTPSFTAYSKAPFGPAQQVRLAEVAHELSERGVRVMLSNSWTESNLERYRGLSTQAVSATRLVNRDAVGRGAIRELLVTSW